MRKSRAETAETRRRIVETGATEFAQKGIHGTGIAELMAAAGLTHGGFYRHFASKDQLVAEACAVGMKSQIASQSEEAEGLEAIERYLSTDHRDSPVKSCPLAWLGSELARSDADVRAAATAGFLTFVDVVAKRFPDSKPGAAKAKALVAVSAMIGALTTSRIVDDPELSSVILQETKKHLIGI